MKTLYVGNLPYTAPEADVEKLFLPCGQVHSVKLMNCRETGRARGSGLVEMDAAGAAAATEAPNGADFDGRGLRVNLAQGRQPGPQRRAG